MRIAHFAHISHMFLHISFWGGAKSAGTYFEDFRVFSQMVSHFRFMVCHNFFLVILRYFP